MTTIEKIQNFFEMTEQEQNVLRGIGWYYHDKYHESANTIRHIQDLGIHKIIIENKIIYVGLERPGLFIGERGSNISDIEKYLSEHNHDFKGYKFHIVEVRRPPIDFLTSWMYAYYDIDEI